MSRKNWRSDARKAYLTGLTLLAGIVGLNIGAVIYIIKYSFYLLNSFNGLRIWLGLSREDPVLDM